MQALHCALTLTLLLLFTLKSTAQPEGCQRRFTSGGADCGSVTDTCTLDTVDGPSLNNVDFPPDKSVDEKGEGELEREGRREERRKEMEGRGREGEREGEREGKGEYD